MSFFKSEKNLEKVMEKKWDKLNKDFPDYNAQYLYAMHKLVYWYEHQKKNITN